MEGVGGVWKIRWWWWWVRPFDNVNGVGGFQPKSRNRAAGARLRARRRKRLREAMEGVGGVWEKRWWWWLVRPFDNASGMGGFEPKSRNGAAGARLRARRRKRLREAMEGVGGVWGKRWWWWLVRPFDNASGGGVGSQKKPKTSLWGLVLGWIWVGDGAAASYGAKQPPTIIS